MVTLYNDSLFTSNCKVLVNTINCAGAMGKGIALEFKNRYPDMYFKYKNGIIPKIASKGYIKSMANAESTTGSLRL